MGRLFSSFSTLARRLTKVVVAVIVALVAGGSLGAAFDLINVKAFALTGAIFLILITTWSRSVPRKYKFGIALPLFVFALMKLTAFPGIARLEEAFGDEINTKAFHIAYRVEMPKETDCVDPFVDPKSGAAVKHYLVVDSTFRCFDRPGTIEGEGLRPATNDIAYVIARQASPPSPAPTPRATPQPEPIVVATPAPSPTPHVITAATSLAETEPEPTVVAFNPEPPSTSEDAIPCSRDEHTQKICRDQDLLEQRRRDRMLR